MAVFLAIFVGNPVIAHNLTAQQSRSENTVEEKEVDVFELIHKYSEQYNVSYETMYRIIKCETAGTFDTDIQSYVKYDFSDERRGIVKGDRERSYGLAQIHLPDHPHITIEQATNPDFALIFMADNLSKGRNLWYCNK